MQLLLLFLTVVEVGAELTTDGAQQITAHLREAYVLLVAGSYLRLEQTEHIMLCKFSLTS
jgi:hypothetical protein